MLLNPRDFKIEVRHDGWRGLEDELRVTVRAPTGEVLHEHREVVGGIAVRAIYEALMTALAEAIRHDCRHLTVDFSPAGLLDLVRQDKDVALNTVERSLRQWTLFQLRSFDSVSMHGRSLRQGQASARLDDPPYRLGVFRRQGTV